MRTKVKKRRINWRDFLFELHNRRLSEEYTLFMLKRPNMSKNRCAYYVLKKNYSNTYLKTWMEIYRENTGTIRQIMDAIHLKVF